MSQSTNTSQLNIIAYLKPQCGWSGGVRAVFKKYGLSYEDRDIINNPTQRAEMIQRSGQELSPCVVINGIMLADVSGAEVEEYLLSKQLIQPNAADYEAPIDSSCHNHPPSPASTATINKSR